MLPPKATPAGPRVASEDNAQYWFLALRRHRPAHLTGHHHRPLKRFVTYPIDPKSHLLKSVFIQ